MSVYAITGIPGSGKTLYAIDKWIIPALKAGRYVITNIEGLSIDRICGIYDLDPVSVNVKCKLLDPSDKTACINIWREAPNGALLVLDEAQNYYGSRDWDTKEAKELIPYLTKHRHLGHDVIIITQSLDSVDVTVRRLVALTYNVKRAENIGLKSAAIVFVYDRANIDFAPLGKTLFKYDKTIFRVYASYVAEGITEKRKTMNPILRSPFMWFLVLIVGFGIYTIFFRDFSSWYNKSPKKNTPSQLPAKPSGGEEREAIPPAENTICWVSHSYINGMHILKLKNGGVSYDPSVPACSDF